jgi:hypothetical protein
MESVIVTDDRTKLLTEPEQADLWACEATIGRGLRSFMEVGTALLAIRDQRLYRQNHSDFQQYCERRWGMSRVHAFRQIEAARVCRMLPDGNTPANEAQVRPLTKIRTEDGDLDAKAIVRVWRRVIDQTPVNDSGDKVVPARVVEEAVKPILTRRQRARCAGTCGPQVPDRADYACEPPAERSGDAVAPGRKPNVTDEQFAELRGHVKALGVLIRPVTLPVPLRSVIEDIIEIVLG